MVEKVKRVLRTIDVRLEAASKSLVVTCEVETSLFDRGQFQGAEVNVVTKRIRLSNFSGSSNVKAIAKEVVRKSNYVSTEKLGEVESLLSQLKRTLIEEQYHTKDDVAQEMAGLRKMATTREPRHAEEEEEPARMRDLDKYLELLYEDDLDERIRGSFMISQLTRDPTNLESLVKSTQLLEATARILKEDGRKNMDLAFNLIFVFYSFSHFREFHPIIAQYKIGFLSLSMLDLELRRHRKRQASLDKMKQDYRDCKREGRDTTVLQETFHRESKKVKVLNRRQEGILYICTHLLLNLSENFEVEQKMTKLGIIKHLSKILDRKNPDILSLCMTFLKKLSIVGENVQQMVGLGIAERLIKLLPGDVGIDTDETLIDKALRLLLNLSFNHDLRSVMVDAGLIPKLVQLFQNPAHLQTVLRLMYQLSIDDRCKSLFTYTDAIPMVVDLIIGYPEPLVNPELMALAINLALNKNNSEIMCGNGNLDSFCHRILDSKDPLLMKLLRNISQHDELKPLFKNFLDEFARAAVKAESGEFLVEVLGTLGNLNIEEFQFAKLVKRHALLEFLCACLEKEAAEDDIVLEVIILIGTLATDPKVAPLVSESDVIKGLCDTIIAKQNDDEIILQTFYTFYKLMLHESTRRVLLENTDVVPYMIDMMSDGNAEIRKMADQTLELVKEWDSIYFPDIRRKRFEIWNEEWLKSIEAETRGEKYATPSLSFIDQGNPYFPGGSTSSDVVGRQEDALYQEFEDYRWDLDYSSGDEN